MDVNKNMNRLAEERPIFHSEADFQFALAWQIKQEYENAKVRLEYPFSIYSEKKIYYVDLLSVIDNTWHLFELKYRKRTFTHEGKDGEIYRLRSQSAEDLGRYDYLKDICRLEQITEKLREENINAFGHAIFLTNEPSYWDDKNHERVTDSDNFRIHDGCKIEKGVLCWLNREGIGSKGGRTPLFLNENYKMGWQNYSEFDKGNHKNGNLFRYLLCGVR